MRLLTMFSTLFVSLALHATPAQVIIVRHAEKQLGGYGLTEKGQQRAQALVSYFLHNAAVTHNGTPAAIYAFQPSKKGKGDRALLTMTPLAQSLSMTVDTNFKRDDVQALAQEILTAPAYAGKMVLICWEHHMMAPLAAALGVTPQPPPYNGDNFDRTWVIDFNASGTFAHFADLPQNVLPGDATE